MLPAYDRGGITIYQGDCLEVMPTLEAGSVALVLTDPPYGTTNLEWDLLDNPLTLWGHWRRLCTRNALQVLFSAQPFTTDLIMSNRRGFRYELIWEKNIPVGFFDANRRPLRVHENILIFGVRRGIYNPQKTKAPKTVKRGTKAKQYSQIERLDTHNNGLAFPRDVLYFPRDEEGEGQHPTQKPLPLIQYLIATYSNPGDLVLDCFLGSGTTARACKNLGRRCIGIELRQDYVDIAIARLAQEAMLLEV